MIVTTIILHVSFSNINSIENLKLAKNIKMEYKIVISMYMYVCVCIRFLKHAHKPLQWNSIFPLI